MGAALNETTAVLQPLLLYGLLPVWLLAGLADWWLHRIQRIELTAGWRESLLHVAMVMELGVAVLLVLLLEVNAAVLALLLTACIVHEITLWSDLRYAAARRRIPVVEQWVHGWQIVMPWAGLALLALMHADQALALVGLAGGAADWQLRPKVPPLPLGQIVSVITAAALLVAAPFAEELLRAWRVRSRVSDDGFAAQARTPVTPR